MPGKSDQEIRAQATEAADVAIATAREAVEEKLKGSITLSSGIVLTLRDVPPLAMRQASMAVPLPDPPTVHIESTDRDEANPNDPDYLDEVEDREIVVYQAGVNVALIMGTTCESVPDGYFGPDDIGWVDELTAADIPVDVSTEALRYLNWLHLYALRNAEDLKRVTYNALVRAGLLEAEIAAAIASFLSSARRSADNGGGPEGAGEDGDSVPPPDSGDGA